MPHITKFPLAIASIVSILAIGIFLFLTITNEPATTKQQTATVDTTSDMPTNSYTHSSGSYTVQYPSDWSQGINGSPDPALLDMVYFFSTPAKASKDFDRVEITRFSEKGASFNELVTRYPEHIMEEHNGMIYVLSYNNEDAPEETREVFDFIARSFELN